LKPCVALRARWETSVLTEPGQPSKVSLVAFPRPAQPSEYARASEEIEILLGRLRGVVAIYGLGSVSVPGISDLDRIAVIERRNPIPAIWSRLSEESRYLAMHTPFLVDQVTFQRHRWFAYLEPLRFSSGTRMDIEDRPLPEYTEPLMGAESLAVCLLRLVKQASTGRLKVRQLLCELHSVRHGLTLARLDRSDAAAAWRLVDDVARLRHSWFSSSDTQRCDFLRDVVARAVPALLGALWALGERRVPAESAPREMKLGPPWSNVTLVPSETCTTTVATTRRMRLPLIRAGRISEVWWRKTHPEVPLHPAVLALLSGQGTREQRQFRQARDELVRAYSKFLAINGSGYSPIGLARPFLES
jgi:hypothetical protein